MQISALKKLLQLISPSESPSEEKSSVATSEQETESDIENAESKAQSENDSTVLINADEITAEGEEDHAEERVVAQENRAHLTSSVPRAARVPTGVLTKAELKEIRELFGNMDDGEIQRLYKKVTKNN